MSRSFLFVALAASLVAAPAQAAVLVTIDKSAQQMTVSVDGRPLHQWPVSTGKAGYDTPNGKFKAFRMERDHYSKEWDEAPMPFSIFFTQKGHAIHGSLDVKRLGSPASHGCVRLLPANAEKLFTLVEQEGVLNTTVVLTGVAPSGAPAVARRAPRPDAEQASAQPQYQQPQYQPQYQQPQYQQPQYQQPQYQQPQYQQPYQPQYGQLPRPAYGQQPTYGNPYYGQPQNAQPQYGQPRAYIYRNSYDEPYQPRPRTLFPF